MSPRRTTNKPSGMMAAFADTKRQQTSLMGDIYAHMVKKSALDTSRRQDIIHPSEMAKSDVCPRQIVYRITDEPPSDEKAPNGHVLELIFEEGHSIHSKYQKILADMGRLWGRWECPKCEGFNGWQTGPECPLCHAEMRYKEVPLDIEDQLRMAGHADGAIPDLKAFIEIKSIGVGTLRMEEPDLVREYTKKTVDGKTVVDLDGIWNGLKRPLKSHRIQAGIYLKIAELLGWDFDKMIFIYENKGNQQVKEFTIRYPANLVDPIFEMIEGINDDVDKGILPNRPYGFTKSTKPCSSCIFRTTCYEKEAPNGKESITQRDAGDGARRTGGKAPARPADDPRAAPSSRRLPRATGGSHRAVRQRPDADVHAPDAVVGVPQRPAGNGRSGRKVRRGSR